MDVDNPKTICEVNVADIRGWSSSNIPVGDIPINGIRLVTTYGSIPTDRINLSGLIGGLIKHAGLFSGLREFYIINSVANNRCSQRGEDGDDDNDNEDFKEGEGGFK